MRTLEELVDQVLEAKFPNLKKVSQKDYEEAADAARRADDSADGGWVQHMDDARRAHEKASDLAGQLGLEGQAKYHESRAEDWDSRADYARAHPNNGDNDDN